MEKPSGQADGNKPLKKKLSDLRNRFFDKINEADNDEAQRIVYEALSLTVPKELEFKKMHFQGLGLYREASYERAEQILRKAHGVAPADTEILEDLASTLDALNRHTESLELLKKALRQYEEQDSPPTARCLARLATAAIDSENYQEAERYFEMAGKAVRGNSILANNSLVLYWHYFLLCRKSDSSNRDSYLKKMKQSVEDLQRLSEDWESDYSLLNNLGVVLYLEEKYEASIDILNKTIAVADKKGLAPFNLGLSMYQMKQYKEAAAAFADSVEKLKEEANYPLRRVAEVWLKFSELQAKLRDSPKAIPEQDKDFVDFLAAFMGELDAARNFLTNRHTFLIRDHELLMRPRTLKPRDAVFTVLRHFHHTYPRLEINGPESDRFGGGYFLRFNGVGIAIDPGFNFVANLYRHGFCIQDIDYIVITSSFVDHTNDFERVLRLTTHINSLVERFQEDRELIQPVLWRLIPKKPLGVYLYLSHDASNKLLSAFAERCLEDINVLVPGEEFVLADGAIKLTPVRNKLEGELKYVFPLGLIIDLFEGATRLRRIGYTSDTAWYEHLGPKYKECDIIIAQIGPMLEEEFLLRYNPSHLGIRGCYNLVGSAHPKICLLSDYGQELGMRRAKIVEAFNDTFWEKVQDPAKRTKFISSDLGLEINLRDLTIKARGMDKWVRYDELDENYLVSEHRYVYSKMLRTNRSD